AAIRPRRLRPSTPRYLLGSWSRTLHAARRGDVAGHAGGGVTRQHANRARRPSARVDAELAGNLIPHAAAPKLTAFASLHRECDELDDAERSQARPSSGVAPPRVQRRLPPRVSSENACDARTIGTRRACPWGRRSGGRAASELCITKMLDGWTLPMDVDLAEI